MTKHVSDKTDTKDKKNHKSLIMGVGAAVVAIILLVLSVVLFVASNTETLLCSVEAQTADMSMRQEYSFIYKGGSFDTIKIEVVATAISEESQAEWDAFVDDFSEKLEQFYVPGVTMTGQIDDPTFTYVAQYTFNMSEVTDDSIDAFKLQKPLDTVRNHGIYEARNILNEENEEAGGGMTCEIK